ncbi:MAG: ATP synthase subunit I [Clostridia bacterium]|nr:ATP synthase subunit I [Clostridia bacterium]
MRDWFRKIDPTVKKESLYIATVTGILSLLLQAGFLIARHWDCTVLLGNLLGGITAAGNFFLMGMTVQKAVQKEKKPAADLMKFSQTVRLLLQLAVAVLGFALPCFNGYATILPLFFPRIAIMIRPFLDKNKQ